MGEKGLVVLGRLAEDDLRALDDPPPVSGSQGGAGGDRELLARGNGAGGGLGAGGGRVGAFARPFLLGKQLLGREQPRRALPLGNSQELGVFIPPEANSSILAIGAKDSTALTGSP